MRDPKIKQTFDSFKDENDILIVEPTARMMAEGTLDTLFDLSKKNK
jgi:hypothetical protein